MSELSNPSDLRHALSLLSTVGGGQPIANDVLIYRGSNQVHWSGIGALGIDHGGLAGLVPDDDHTQYALLAGRAGGQILIGGTAAGDDLTLQSTSNATRGSVIFGSAGTTVYDEVNDRLGIGTATIPHGGIGTAKVAIEGPDSSALGPQVQITTDADDYPLFSIDAWAHDDIALLFDCYKNVAGAYVSSDAGSNWRIRKASDALSIDFDVGQAVGTGIGWRPGIVIDSSGGTYGHVGIGPGAPSTNLHVYESNNHAVAALRIEQAGIGDCAMEFRIAGGIWISGVDNSDSDSFKIGIGTSLLTTANMKLVITRAGDVGIGVLGSPVASAKVDIDSTTGALLIPRMTTAQIAALAAVDGMIVYDSTIGAVYAREAGAWVNL